MDKKQCPDCGEWIYTDELDTHRKESNDESHGPAGGFSKEEADNDQKSTIQSNIHAENIPANRGRIWSGPKAFPNNQCPETVEGELAALHGELLTLQTKIHDLSQSETGQSQDYSEEFHNLNNKVESLNKKVNRSSRKSETDIIPVEVLLGKCPDCDTDGLTKPTGLLWWKSKAGICGNCGYNLFSELFNRT